MHRLPPLPVLLSPASSRGLLLIAHLSLSAALAEKGFLSSGCDKSLLRGWLQGTETYCLRFWGPEIRIRCQQGTLPVSAPGSTPGSSWGSCYSYAEGCFAPLSSPVLTLLSPPLSKTTCHLLKELSSLQRICMISEHTWIVQGIHLLFILIPYFTV